MRVSIMVFMKTGPGHQKSIKQIYNFSTLNINTTIENLFFYCVDEIIGWLLVSGCLCSGGSGPGGGETRMLEMVCRPGITD